MWGIFKYITCNIASLTKHCYGQLPGGRTDNQLKDEPEEFEKQRVQVQTLGFEPMIIGYGYEAQPEETCMNGSELDE